MSGMSDAHYQDAVAEKSFMTLQDQKTTRPIAITTTVVDYACSDPDSGKSARRNTGDARQKSKENSSLNMGHHTVTVPSFQKKDASFS